MAEGIEFRSEVNEAVGVTTITQTFKNEKEEAVELFFSYEKQTGFIFTQFQATIDKKVVISKVLEKTKAEEKYNDTVASGNVGIMMSWKKEEEIEVYIGNLQPKKEIVLKATFIQQITTNDMSYEFSLLKRIPHLKNKNGSNIIPENVKGEINLKVLSKLTRLVTKGEKYDIKKEIAEDKKGAKIFLNIEEISTSLSVLFRTEDMEKPKLFEQYDPEKKETSYSLNYIYKSPLPIQASEAIDQDEKVCYYKKYLEKELENETPGLFIFLFDQSGSMSGKPIEMVKKSLILFLQSLPIGSYFQLIGFGSTFITYEEKPLKYTKENIEDAIKTVETLDADLGGTEISVPLLAITSEDNKIYDDIKLSKIILILTDGDVEDTEECLEIVERATDNFRIHSFGLGNDYNEELIERIGRLGKGSYNYVNNIEDLDDSVIFTLSKTLRPYIQDLKFELNGLSTSFKYPKSFNITYPEESINFYFILRGPPAENVKVSLKGELKEKDETKSICQEFSFTEKKKFEDGNQLAKIIIYNIIKETSNIELEVKLAKKYQILTKNTALFGEIKEDKASENKILKIKYEREESYDGGEEEDICLDDDDVHETYAKPPPISALPAPGEKCSDNYVECGCASENVGMNSEPNYCNNMCSCENMNSSSSEKYDLDEEEEKEEKKEEKIELIKILSSQHPIEGWWKKNNFTEKILGQEGIKHQLDEITKLVEGKKLEDEVKEKIIVTFIVLFYLHTVEKESLSKSKFIIKKADNFLKKFLGNGYEELVKTIG